MKAISTYLVGIERKVATMEAEEGLLAKSNAGLLSSAIQNGAKSARTEDSFMETTFSLYFGFILHMEKAIVPHCCKVVSKLVLIYFSATKKMLEAC